jgi:RHS repeat-associated protein
VGALSYLDPKHPHAVTSAAGGMYKHDAVGNQIMRPGGVSITYTPFNLPKTIQQGATTVSFGYGGDQQRIRKTTPANETLYFEELFEQVTAGANQEFRYYVSSPERVIAVVTRGGNEPGPKYVHVDHLRSVETITNNDGTIAEKRSYDAYGAKRNPKWGEPGGVTSGKTTKGFTGHEEEDEFGLINMRGRLFDPHLARFTTPDPVIPDIFDGQSFNSFAYVWNNPLTWVDPSGFAPGDPEEDVEYEWVEGGYTYDESTGQLEFSGQWQPVNREKDNVGASAPTTDMGTTGVSGAAQTAKEGFGSFIEGLVKGSLSDNDSWSAVQVCHIRTTPSSIRIRRQERRS